MKMIFRLLVLAGLICAAGCNTMKGVGRDVEDVGDAIEKSAS